MHADALGLAPAAIVEQTQFHLFRVLGKQREIDAFTIPAGAQRGYGWAGQTAEGESFMGLFQLQNDTGQGWQRNTQGKRPVHPRHCVGHQ